MSTCIKTSSIILTLWSDIAFHFYSSQTSSKNTCFHYLWLPSLGILASVKFSEKYLIFNTYVFMNHHLLQLIYCKNQFQLHHFGLVQIEFLFFNNQYDPIRYFKQEDSSVQPIDAWRLLPPHSLEKNAFRRGNDEDIEYPKLGQNLLDLIIWILLFLHIYFFILLFFFSPISVIMGTVICSCPFKSSCILIKWEMILRQLFDTKYHDSH